MSSYLDPAEHLRAALESGADAVHPGYGFLAESAAFAEAVSAAGLVWVGPPAAALRLGGDKLEAKRIAARSGVPTAAAGHAGGDRLPAAREGGRRWRRTGMRVVRAAAELEDALAAAQREAELGIRRRHGVLRALSRAAAARRGAAAGRRRHGARARAARLLGPAPPPEGDRGVSPPRPRPRRRLQPRAARAPSRSDRLPNAGTAEFLVDGDDAYFLELNGRIQVEHPVTEAVTGLDIVELQLRVAAGETARRWVLSTRWTRDRGTRLRRGSGDVPPSGGTITRLRLPAGVRVDTGVEEGDEIGTSYDPMIAKLIAHGATREDALDGLGRRSRRWRSTGSRRTSRFCAGSCAPRLSSGRVSTAFLTRPPAYVDDTVAPAAGPIPRSVAPEPAVAAARGAPSVGKPPTQQSRHGREHGDGSDAGHRDPGRGRRRAMQLTAHDPLVVLEAMKMEMPVMAPFAATVTAVLVAAGDRVATGARLVELR